MEKIKQSFKRIIAWAKKHPWAAVGIVGAVVLVGWLVYRKQSSAGNDAVVNQYGAGGGELGGAGGGATGYEDLIPAANAAAPLTLSSPQPSGDPGAYYSLPSSDYGFSSFSDPSAFYPSYSAALEPAPTSAPMLYDFGLAGVAPAGGLLAGLTAAANVPINAPSYDFGQAGIAPVGGLVSGLAEAANTPIATPAPVAAAPTLASIAVNNAVTGGPTGNLTPSQLVGKGRRFTGTYQGVTYQNGYPVSSTFGTAGIAPAAGLSSGLSAAASVPTTAVQPVGAQVLVGGKTAT